MNEPLGTLRSWVLDGVLTGALIPPAVLVTEALFRAWLYGVPFYALSWDLASATLAGAVLGLLLAPPILILARSWWRTPVLVLVSGAWWGALCVGTLEMLLCPKMDGWWSRWGTAQWWMLLGFGAFVLGPPWMAYIAVRSRGRSGTPIVLVSVLWASLSVLPVVGFAWLRGWLP